MVSQVVKKFSCFCAIQRILTASLKPAIGPYPEPFKSGLHLRTLFICATFNIIFPCALTFCLAAQENTRINIEVYCMWKAVRPLSTENELRRTTKGHDIFPYQSEAPLPSP
jgi:hypothetical protein